MKPSRKKSVSTACRRIVSAPAIPTEAIDFISGQRLGGATRGRHGLHLRQLDVQLQQPWAHDGRVGGHDRSCRTRQARRYRGLSMARSAPHMGELARAGRNALFALQELAGWKTEKMVRRYAHLGAEHLAIYAGNTESHGTNTAQPPDFRGTAPIASHGKLKKLVVARGGIEPPTRGLSVRVRNTPNHVMRKELFQANCGIFRALTPR